MVHGLWVLSTGGFPWQLLKQLDQVTQYHFALSASEYFT